MKMRRAEVSAPETEVSGPPKTIGTEGKPVGPFQAARPEAQLQKRIAKTNPY